MVKKIAAAKVIQKYFHRKLKMRFSWVRYMPEHDASEIEKMREKDAARRKILQEQADRLGLTLEEMEAGSEKNARKIAEEDKIRRAAELKTSKANLAANSQSTMDKPDTVLFEGVELPSFFFTSLKPGKGADDGNEGDDGLDNQVLKSNNTKKEPSHNDGRLKEPVKTPEIFEPIQELGFRGYETPMRSTSPKLKRVLSAIPLSRHLYPVRIHHDETAVTSKTSVPVGRPMTAPNMERGRNEVVTGREDVSKSMESTSHRKKSDFYKEIDDNINKLGKTNRRRYGLPMDVLTEQERPTGLQTGIKFLQAVSTSTGKKNIFSSLTINPSSKTKSGNGREIQGRW